MKKTVGNQEKNMTRIKVAAAAVCATDLEVMKNKRRLNKNERDKKRTT